MAPNPVLRLVDALRAIGTKFVPNHGRDTDKQKAARGFRAA